MSERIDSGSWFAIKGWHGAKRAYMHILSRAELELADRIITEELSQFAPRLKTLDVRLDPSAPAYEAVKASRLHQKFKLTAEVHAAPLRKKSLATSLNEPVLAVPRTDVNHLDLSAVAWLDSMLPENPRILQVGSVPTLFRDRPARGDLVIETVLSGEGTISPSKSGFSNRYRASQDSLAAWLSFNPPTERNSVALFCLGEDCTQLDVELLRMRLFPHQKLMLPQSSAAIGTLLRVWDGEIYHLQDCMIFANPGPSFCDPSVNESLCVPVLAWPKITVVTVSYNQAKYLEDCLNSVLGQNYPNLEYIVIDAISTDGSIDILKKYENRISRLIIEKDRGQSDGLNKGFQLATGDLLTWVNSDDMLAPNALVRAALTFMRYDCDVVVGGCERITSNSDEVSFLHHSAIPFLQKVPLGFAQNLLWNHSWEKGDYFFQPEVVFSAGIWNRSGGYLKEHLYWAMDWDLWIRMAMAGATVVHIPDTIGRSREHPDQKTTSDTLYLYQLKNILLEYQDAIFKVTTAAEHVPAGTAIPWPDNSAGSQNTAPLDQPMSLLARLVRLRNPTALKGAIRSRLPIAAIRLIRRMRESRHSFHRFYSSPSRIELNTREIARLHAENEVLRSENLNLREHAANVATLQSGFAEKVTKLQASFERKAARVKTKYENDVSSIREYYENTLKEQANEIKREYENSLLSYKETYSKSLSNMNAQYEESIKNIRTQLEAAKLDADDIKYRLSEADSAYQSFDRETRDWIQSLPQYGRRQLAKYLVDFVMPFLFDLRATKRGISRVDRLLADGASLLAILKEIARTQPDLHATRRFREVRALLTVPCENPVSIAIKDKIGEFVIVDVGAEGLEFESHIYGPLAQKWSCHIVGFDPFCNISSQDNDTPDAFRDSFTAHPCFIGSGERATFHINRYRPTSSLLPSNLKLLKPFGALAESLKTVRRKTVETYRLDDFVTKGNWANSKIDLLKVDVQGGTFDVISHAPNILDGTLICHLEVEFSEVYKGERLFGDIDDVMRAAGFGLLDFFDVGHSSYDAFAKSHYSCFHAGRQLWADAIYVRSLDSLRNLENDELLRLSVMLHEIYKKYDAAAECLSVYGKKVDEDLHSLYVREIF